MRPGLSSIRRAEPCPGIDPQAPPAGSAGDLFRDSITNADSDTGGDARGDARSSALPHCEVYSMNDNEQDPNDAQGERNDNETILMALDQISQTIDVMTSVVGRLRHFVQEQEMAEEVEVREAMRPGRTLH